MPTSSRFSRPVSASSTRCVLPGEAHHPARLHRVREHIDTGHLGPTGVGSQQRREDPDGGGLAGAVGSEQPEHGAPRDRKLTPASARMSLPKVLTSESTTTAGRSSGGMAEG